MRILHLGILIPALLVVVTAERVSGQPDEVGMFQFAFYAVAVADVGVLYFLRRHRMRQAAREFERDPASPLGWSLWRQAQFLTWVIAFTFVLFGMVLRVLGGTLVAAAPLYATGFLFLVLYAPRLDPRGRPHL